MRLAPGWLLVAVACAAACGGHYSHTETDGSGDDAGNAGKPAGHAGKASGGATSSGGKTSGVSGTSACTCPDIDCPSGFIVAPDPNGCCLACQPYDCKKELAGYFDFEEQLLEKYSGIGCKTDTECGVLYENNSCNSNCGVPLPSQVIMEASFNLDSYAQMTCSNCPPVPIPPCPMLPPPICFNGRCVFSR